MHVSCFGLGAALRPKPVSPNTVCVRTFKTDLSTNMTFSLHGLAVSTGIAIGRAHLVSNATLEVAQYQVREKDIPAEIAAL